MEKFANYLKTTNLSASFLFVFALITLTGCASINIPNYIQDQNPYKERFYASYDKVYSVTVEALIDKNWKINKQSDPVIYEQNKQMDDPNAKQTLLITELHELPVFLGTRYARMNVYIRYAGEKETDVEIRYLSINSVFFKEFHNYKHEIAVERIFSSIDEKLGL